MPKKNTYIKKIQNPRTYDRPQIDIKKSLDDDKKINPSKIFEGYSKSKKK